MLREIYYGELWVQIVAMLDATDSMTSQTIEARHSYQASDIVLNSMPLLLRRRNNGQLVVDYSCFVQRSEDDCDHATNGGNLSPDRCATSMCMDSPDAARAFAEQLNNDHAPHPFMDAAQFMDALPCCSTSDEHVTSGVLHKSDPTGLMGLTASCPLGDESATPFPGMEKEGSVDAFAQWRLEGGHSLMDLDTVPAPGAHFQDDRRRSMSGVLQRSSAVRMHAAFAMSWMHFNQSQYTSRAPLRNDVVPFIFQR